MIRRDFFKAVAATVGVLALPIPAVDVYSGPLVIVTTSGRRLSRGELAEIVAYFESPPPEKFLLLAPAVRVEVRS